jgi:hypothetical protein
MPRERAKARISPIIIGLGMVAAAGAGLGAYRLVRSPSRGPAPAAAGRGGDDGARASVVEPSAPPPRVPVSPPLALVPAPEPEARRPGTATNVALKQRALLMADHNERIVEDADERAFEAMKLPDETRLAIRRINDRYATATHEFLAVNPSTWSPGEQQGANIANSEEADRARRAALKDLLGIDGVSAFEGTEHAAVRRLQRRYGGQDDERGDAPSPHPFTERAGHFAFLAGVLGLGDAAACCSPG